MMRRGLRRAWGGLLALTAAGAGAQMHVVKKPETVVRAVGVYEWTGDEAKPTASRLMPVTLFIDGKLEDASVYLARPVPFALGTGTIFELDQAGVGQGLLELSFARHLSAEGGDFDDGWMGFGAYKPLPKEPVVAKKKSGPLSKIEVSGGKTESSGPKFAKKPAASGDTAASKSDGDPGAADPDRPTMRRRDDGGTASTTDGSKAGADKASTASGADDSAANDPDRPTMKRRTDSGASDASAKDAGSGGDTPAQTADKTDTADPDDKAERPTLRKRTEAQRQEARKQHDTSSVSSVGSLNDDPDRPSLHRGKPASSLDEDDVPALVGLPAGMKQQVAVSDAVNRPVHDFARAWASDAERATVLGKLQGIARAKLAEYDASGNAGSAAAAAAPAAAKAPVANTPAARAAAARAAARRKAAAAKASSTGAVALSDEVLKAYTLSYGGAATYFYSATATAMDGVKRYVSVVAQQEETGELRTAMSRVTDERHLDRTPQLRLVDVVDVEASNRASLLMELRAEKSRQFALYRVIGAEAQQTFVSGITE